LKQHQITHTVGNIFTEKGHLRLHVRAAAYVSWVIGLEGRGLRLSLVTTAPVHAKQWAMPIIIMERA
jgi:hypothetical protein